MQTCSSPQSMALVQLGGAQTWWLLQLAPGAHAWLLVHGLPTGVHLALMQLLPASQSPEREHCGRSTHAPAMQLAPPEHSLVAAHWVSTRPEHPHAVTAAIRRADDVLMRTEEQRSRTRRASPASTRDGIRWTPVRGSVRRGYLHTTTSLA